MDYRDYQYIINSLERDYQQVHSDFVRAYVLGAEQDDILPNVNAEKERIRNMQKQLKRCVKSWVKEIYPDNKELQDFWGVGDEDNE